MKHPIPFKRLALGALAVLTLAGGTASMGASAQAAPHFDRPSQAQTRFGYDQRREDLRRAPPRWAPVRYRGHRRHLPSRFASVRADDHHRYR